MSNQKQPPKYIVCRPCSEAGGAWVPVEHEPPECPGGDEVEERMRAELRSLRKTKRTCEYKA